MLLRSWMLAMLVLLGGPAPAGAEHRDVAKLFATTCGWCHEAGGRRAGKGPQLMHTTRDDAFIRARIKAGRPGRMPGFGRALSEQDIEDIIAYIRKLEPET